MTLPVSWRKSSYSGDGQNCVEVHREHTAVRDTKNPGVTLAIPRSAWTSLVREIAR